MKIEGAINQDQVPEKSDVSFSLEEIFEKKSKLKVLQEKMKSFLEKDDNPLVREQAELAEKMLQGTFLKISNQLGSNEGGWYIDKSTMEKYYVKFYKNSDQARAEFISNAIYKQVGINAVDSQLFEFEGRLAIASREIPGAKSMDREDLTDREDVIKGFVTDAYLANWDVVGLVYDNIVQGADGQAYRIDNGGSLNFRAQGGPKDFLADEIKELETMLNPSFQAGQVFSSIDEQEMKEQATLLVNNLSEEKIKEIVLVSGLELESAKKIEASLLGRRRYLIKRFDLEKKNLSKKEGSVGPKRVPGALERIRKIEKLETLRSSVAILADADDIENQQVDLIDASDLGRFEISFKLTSDKYRRIIEKLKQMKADGSGVVTSDNIRYEQKNGGNEMSLSEAYTLEIGNIKIRVSLGNHGKRPVLSSLGLVRIEIPNSEINDPKELGEKIDEIFREHLEISTGLEIPEEEAELQYKKARYMWQEKVDSVPPEVLDCLQRKEVFPGYHTIVREGRHKELQKMSPYVIFHSLFTAAVESGSFVQTLKNGLLCTHARFKRGLLYEGWSSHEDMVQGGADSVFTRTFSQKGFKKFGSESINFPNNVSLVINPRVFDRTDWFAYVQDRYGTTDPDQGYKERQSPEQLFKDQEEDGYQSGNEQMFRCGIAQEDFQYIACKTEEVRDEVIAQLLEGDIKEINGLPIEQAVILAQTPLDILDMEAGHEMRSKINREVKIGNMIMQLSWLNGSYNLDLSGLDRETWLRWYQYNGMWGLETVSHFYFGHEPQVAQEALDYFSNLAKTGIAQILFMKKVASFSSALFDGLDVKEAYALAEAETRIPDLPIQKQAKVFEKEEFSLNFFWCGNCNQYEINIFENGEKSNFGLGSNVNDVKAKEYILYIENLLSEKKDITASQIKRKISHYIKTKYPIMTDTQKAEMENSFYEQYRTDKSNCVIHRIDFDGPYVLDIYFSLGVKCLWLDKKFDFELFDSLLTFAENWQKQNPSEDDLNKLPDSLEKYLKQLKGE